MKFFFLIVLLCLPLLAQDQINPQKLDLFDRHPSIAAQLGEDRISKYLLRTGTPPQQLTHAFLDRMIAKSLAGRGLTLIGQDLNRGDDRLRGALAKLLYAQNFNNAQTQAILLNLSTIGPSDNLRKLINTAIANPAVMRLLRDYLLETPECWPRVVAGLEAMTAGKTPITDEILKRALLRATNKEDAYLNGEITKARTGDPQARWNVANATISLLNLNGATIRYLKSFEPHPVNWYETMWLTLTSNIASTPALTTEYLERGANAQPLYWELHEVFRDTMESRATEFCRQYCMAGRIPGSRCSLTLNDIDRQSTVPTLVNAAYSSTPPTEKVAHYILQKCDENPGGADYFLWHLTRPAEALVYTLRQNLPAAVGSDEASARRMLNSTPLFTGEIEEALQNLSFGSDAIGVGALRKRLASGLLPRAKLLEYASQIFRQITFDDNLWSSILLNATQNSEDLLRFAIQTTVDNDPQCVRSWVETILWNNKQLKKTFFQWLVTEKRVVDEPAAERWIITLQRAMASNKIVGNTEVALFKGYFNKYTANAEGWRTIRSHLAAETLVPQSLREALGQTYQANPDRFWRFYGMCLANHGDASATLRPSIQSHLNDSKIAQTLLVNISERNQLASDAIDPVWDVILAPNAPLTKAFLAECAASPPGGYLYELSAMALAEALRKPDIWPIIRLAVLQHLQLPTTTGDRQLYASIRSQLMDKQQNGPPFVIRALSYPEVTEAWRQNILSSVKYLDKAFIIANFIIRHSEMQKEWTSVVVKTITEDPAITRAVLAATSQVSDSSHKVLADPVQQRLQKTLLSNRILFEQILAYKNNDLKKEVQARAATMFGHNEPKS